jgi:hypothetical protein
LAAIERHPEVKVARRSARGEPSSAYVCCEATVLPPEGRRNSEYLLNLSLGFVRRFANRIKRADYIVLELKPIRPATKPSDRSTGSPSKCRRRRPSPAYCHRRTMMPPSSSPLEAYPPGASAGRSADWPQAEGAVQSRPDAARGCLETARAQNSRGSPTSAEAIPNSAAIRNRRPIATNLRDVL